MKVLLACEESQAVCLAFRELGHEAYSCDTEPCSGGHPEWHLQTPVENILHHHWDMMIAFPPCTYLTCTANRAMRDDAKTLFKLRHQKREDALIFVQSLMLAKINKIAIENPIGVISTRIRKPDQYIQPFEYGHTDSKKTCLWLKNLPQLVPENIVEPEWVICQGKRYSKAHYSNPNNGHLRSKTYSGIASAMANQWG